MKFTKMHGAGNDYVYVNGFEETIPDCPSVAKTVSNRRFGIGSDGLIVVLPSKTADVRMKMYNADGSEAQMCGNGIRCVGKFAYENGLVEKNNITVETESGIKNLTLHMKNDIIESVTVDMGIPGLLPSEIGMLAPDGIVERFVHWPVKVGGQDFWGTAVSMGNPHWVFFLEDNRRTLATGSDMKQALESLNLETIGPAFENHIYFPSRVNTEFAYVDMIKNEIVMRVYERGSGETFACGTGACAVFVAAVLNGRCHHNGKVKLRGGDLYIEWNGNGQHLYMTGNAVTVFTGEITI